jgi:ketosteroid isomerase-like protein
MVAVSVAAAPKNAGAAIRANSDAFDTAMRAGNVDGFMAFYADDAVLMPPNAPDFKGTEAIRRFWSGLLAAGKTDVDLVVEDVTGSGDLAIERGHYELTAPFKDSGKYIVVWRYRGGKWKIIDDIFNSSLVPPPPPQQ